MPSKSASTLKDVTPSTASSASAVEEVSVASPARAVARKKNTVKKAAAPADAQSPARVEDLDSPYPSPQRVVPVVGAVYGLGRRHIEDGLMYIFERWFECNAGDEFKIMMNGIEMASDVVTTATQNDDRFYLTIPRSTLLLHFVDDVYGEVRRVGTGAISTSPPERILILNTLPGGDGPPEGSYHPGLVFSLSHTFVDAVVAAGGVKVTIKPWVNMRLNDLVMFYWGPHRFELPPITDLQVGHDVTFTIDSVFLAAAGSGHFVVQFYLFDEVLDESGPYHRWSKPIPVNVDLDKTLLREPEVVEADPQTLILDADELHGFPATASVFLPNNDPNFVTGDFILMTIEGTTVDGELLTLNLRQEAILRSYNDFPIPNAFVRSLIQSTMTVHYRRERGLLPSRSITVAISGIRYALPKPDVDQAHGPFVAPDLPYITVRMPDYQPPGNTGDELQVNILGEYLDGTIERVFSNRAAGEHPRLRDFITSEYARFEGLAKTRVYYRVTGLANIRESERRYIQVGRPPRDLSPPHIQEADNTHNIDPDTLGSVGTLESRAEFKTGDEVIIQYVGSVTGVRIEEYVLAVATNPLLTDIAKQLFLDNLDGTLRVSYVRIRFGVAQQSEEAVFTVGRALGALAIPEVLQATTEPDELDPALVAVSGATVRVRYDTPKTGDKVEVCFRGLDGAGTYFAVEDAVSGVGHVDCVVPPEVIGFNIHPLGRGLEVSYRVIRNGFPTPSPVLYLYLKTLSHLPGAEIDGIGKSAILEIPKLDDLARTRVAPWLYVALGQRMWLRYAGTFDDDTVYEEETYAGREVADTELLNGPAPYAPVARLRRLKDWTDMRIEFGVTFNHSNNLSDVVWFETRHHMVQSEVNVFPHPEIKYATPPTGPVVVISPVTVENKCQVLVSYPNMNQGGVDQITLYWLLPDGTALEVDTLPGLDGGTVTFNISNDIVAVSINTTIQLQYETVLGRGGSGSSEVQSVTVLAIPQASLPKGLINGVPDGGTINPASLSGNAVLKMLKWPFSRAGQFAWITLSSPGVAALNLLVAHEVTPSEAANGFANIAVLRSWLLSVPNNGTVTVTPHVNFVKHPDKTQAVAFPTTRYVIRHTTALVFNAQTVYLNRLTYLLDGYPQVLPTFGSGNQVQYGATGGTAPYTYSSSNGNVASVTSNSGLVQSRGNGSAVITVRDSSVPAQTRSYSVVVSNVVRCVGLSRSTFGNIRAAAANAGSRLPNLDEARAIHAAYGNRWPMGFALYWTSTFSHSLFFSNYYYALNLNTGEVGTGKDSVVGEHFNGVGLR